MKEDWLPRFAQKTFLVVIGLICGLVFALWLEVGYPIGTNDQPGWCNNVSWLCFVYEWQTLVAGVLAIGVGVATVLTMRNDTRQQREFAKFQEFLRLWNGVGHAQATNIDLLVARKKFEKLLDDMAKAKAPLPRSRLSVLSWRGATIPKEIDPIIHYLLEKVWDVINSPAKLMNHPGAPSHLGNADVDEFKKAIVEIEKQRLFIQNTIIEPQVTFFQRLGIHIRKNKDGVYLYELPKNKNHPTLP